MKKIVISVVIILICTLSNLQADDIWGTKILAVEVRTDGVVCIKVPTNVWLNLPYNLRDTDPGNIAILQNQLAIALIAHSTANPNVWIRYWGSTVERISTGY